MLEPAQIAPARKARTAHAAATAALSAAALAGGRTINVYVEIALVLGASLGAITLARREALDPGDPRPIVWSIAALFGFAVLVPSQFSGDLWSYAMVGRRVVAHHVSPYRVAPDAFPHDPMLHLVGREWQHGTNPYGPLFVVLAAFIAKLAGTHALLYRFAFQGVAALSIAVALRILWRTNHSTSSLVLVGLHPIIALSIINGGHNDALIALGILIAVLCLERGRYGTAGWVLAVAVLVKATAGIALAPLVAWAWVRDGRRAASDLLVPTDARGRVDGRDPGLLPLRVRRQLGCDHAHVDLEPAHSRGAGAVPARPERDRQARRRDRSRHDRAARVRRRGARARANGIRRRASWPPRRRGWSRARTSCRGTPCGRCRRPGCGRTAGCSG